MYDISNSQFHSIWYKLHRCVALYLFFIVQSVFLDFRLCFLLHLFFFFQAEDGIRDFHVTGVQTCALPISSTAPRSWPRCSSGAGSRRTSRSEERRVGKECRSRWSPDVYKKKNSTVEL